MYDNNVFPYFVQRGRAVRLSGVRGRSQRRSGVTGMAQVRRLVLRGQRGYRNRLCGNTE